MSDWYRNEAWDEPIAAAFESKLSRSRNKAQYLSLQGYALIARYPASAKELLQRAVALDDYHETVRALAFLALACLASGDVDGALEAYEAGFERQSAQPNIVAISVADYAFAVGYWRRKDRLPVVEPLADSLPVDDIFGPNAQSAAARAMVRDMMDHPGAGEDARLALELFADVPDAAALGVSIADLRGRLETIAAG
jgi:hypothetical protein